jgi:hypothetical protein
MTSSATGDSGPAAESGATMLTAATIQARSSVEIDEYLQAVQQLSSPQERYSIYETIALQAEMTQDVLDAIHEKAWAAMSQDTDAWRTAYSTYTEFAAQYATLKDRATAAATQRNRREETRRGLENVGVVGEDWARIVPTGATSDSLLRAATQAAKALSKNRVGPDAAIGLINHVVVGRITEAKSRRGGARILGPSTTDYQKIAKMTPAEHQETHSHEDAELLQLGLRRTGKGLVEATAGADTMTLPDLAQLREGPQALPPAPRGPNIAEDVPQGPDAPEDIPKAKRQRTGTPSEASAPSGLSTNEGGDDGPTLRRSKRIRVQRAEQGDGAGTLADNDGEEEGSLNDGAAEDQATGAHASNCSCSPQVTAAFKKLSQTSELRQTALKRETERLKAAQQFRTYVEQGVAVCARHVKATATAVGLRTRFSADVLSQRLTTYAGSRSTVGNLKAASATYWWFAQAVRGLHPEEIRGVFKYDVARAADPIAFRPHHEHILQQMQGAYGVAIAQEYEAVGTVNVPIFGWWFEEHDTLTLDGVRYSIAELAKLEMSMYEWHFRKESGNSGSLGWLRNMYHSGIQQLLRQDPEYYRLYVALRPDHHWRLMTYPYYAKLSQAGDSTFFRHIDLNITQYLIDGRGGAMIQGSVSLDDETLTMCTEMLLGMHLPGKIQEWYGRVKERIKDKNILDAFVNRIQDKKIWSAEDAAHFGRDFEPVPCKAGDARISSPLLPHGSTSMPAKGIRRTLLPWFVAIQDNHEDMETIEMGTWEEIAAAHRALEAAKRSPSGKPNVYGGIPYRFPASSPLVLPSPLSAALVGRTRWDMPDVLAERDLVLGNDDAAYRDWLEEWRQAARTGYIQHFRLIRSVEQALYAEKSFWRNGGDVARAPPADSEMTAEIQQEINRRQRADGIEREVHGQEGAMPGTVDGAPTEQELRSSPDELREIRRTLSDVSMEDADDGARDSTSGDDEMKE